MSEFQSQFYGSTIVISLSFVRGDATVNKPLFTINAEMVIAWL